MMICKSSIFALFLCLICLGPRNAFADQLKLTSTNNGVFPYTFDVTASGKTTSGVSLACLNSDRTISIGEQWNVNIENLETLITQGKAVDTTLSAAKEIADLKGDAYLDSLFNTGAGTDAEIQNAIWDVLNPGSKSLDATAQALENTALKVIAGTITEPSSFYSEFTFYTPTNGNGSRNEPQQFLGYSPRAAGVTPEPSSLILLGTGMAGLAGGVRRRMKA